MAAGKEMYRHFKRFRDLLPPPHYRADKTKIAASLTTLPDTPE